MRSIKKERSFPSQHKFIIDIGHIFVFLAYFVRPMQYLHISSNMYVPIFDVAKVPVLTLGYGFCSILFSHQSSVTKI